MDRVPDPSISIYVGKLIITGRNGFVAKVIFLHLFVILFTGGGGVVVSHKALRQTPPPD